MSFQHSARRLAVAVVATAVAAGALVAVSGSAAIAATPEQQIAAKAKKYKSKVGAPVTAYRTTTRYGKRITYRKYKTAVIAHNGSAVKLVTGAMYRSYAKRKGVTGKLGAPVTTKKCYLIENACIQRFQYGSIYRNRKTKNLATVWYGTGAKTSLIATALSQKGYLEPGHRKNKYGKWLNGGKPLDRAWCSFFQSWVSAASGNGQAVPKRKSFTSFRQAVKARGGLSKKPAVGKLAFIDYFGDGTSSHVGLVVAVHSKTIRLLEGNIRPSSSSAKGVVAITRNRSQVRFYVTPRY